MIFYSKLAIDDVRITKGDCPNAGDCNFEDKTLCGYTNTPDSKIKWIVAKGSLSTITGPSSDHTFQNSQGSYAVFGKKINKVRFQYLN